MLYSTKARNALSAIAKVQKKKFRYHLGPISHCSYCCWRKKGEKAKIKGHNTCFSSVDKLPNHWAHYYCARNSLQQFCGLRKAAKRYHFRLCHTFVTESDYTYGRKAGKRWLILVSSLPIHSLFRPIIPGQLS
jgi:hypothetical protein